MDISKHIVELLKTQECVVIPDFGGFLVDYVPSNFVDGRIMPPSKEVAFNSSIRKNDGILIHHIADVESITYSQALVAIQAFVDYSILSLYDGKRVDFEGLGYICFDKSGNYVFHKEQNQQYADFYGLPQLSVSSSGKDRSVVAFDYKASTVSNKTNWIAVAACLLLLITLSLFPVITDHNVDTGNVIESSIVVDSDSFVTNSIVAVSDSIENNSEISENELVNDSIAGESTSEAEIVTEVKETKLPYVVVAGCFSKRDNAENLYEELKLLGYNSEIYPVGRNNLLRVIVDSYSTLEEATIASAKFKNENPGTTVWASAR